jgi:hypothetical protein
MKEWHVWRLGRKEMLTKFFYRQTSLSKVYSEKFRRISKGDVTMNVKHTVVGLVMNHVHCCCLLLEV